MNEELNQQFEWMNQNLNAIVVNQAMLYCKLKDIEDKLSPEEREE